MYSWTTGLARPLIQASLGLLATIIAYTVCYMVYNVYFHPLRMYPGPKWWAASRLPWIWVSTQGRLHREVLKLHKTYGPVVRIGPKELVFTSPDAWKQIYGLRPVEMQKDLRGAGLMPTFSDSESIITCSRNDHSRMRRTVAHAFSEKALREQEPILESYVDTLISRLKDKSADGPVDVVEWFNWTTFDIMGDLTYSSPFDCLKEGQYHEWVSQIFLGIKGFPWMQAALHYNIASLRKYLTPKRLVEARERSERQSFASVESRINMGSSDRKDFMSYILRHNDDKGMSEGEIKQTAIILTIAGSETTATFLSGLIYLVLRNKRAYDRLVKEVRDRFQSYADINMLSTNDFTYMPAVVSETFRYYPPSPNCHPRIVPGEGEVIQGNFVPGDTTVGVYQWCAGHDPRNFYNPEEFLPERYLAEKDHLPGDVAASFFEDDKKQAVQPFSFGPRNCLGKNLAYAEIRLMISKLLWEFDMKLAPENDNSDWIHNQPTYMLWEKPPLRVVLSPVQREI